MITRSIKNQHNYLKFYKPYGVLCAFTDPVGRKTLSDFIPVPEVYAAGRLDFDSEGLLILTNDGTVNHRITSPRYHLPKTYLVQVEGEITEDALYNLQQGVTIKGNYQTKRCKAMHVPVPELAAREKPITPHGPTNWLRIEIREGKKRQVRQMTAAVGLPTLRLVRMSIGPIHLGNLKVGEWRHLQDDELSHLLNDLKLKVDR